MKSEITNFKQHDKGIITFTREITWLPGMDTGWGNGYIGFPKNSPIYNKHYDGLDDELPVDQEWTYSQEEEINGVTYWVVGFDSAHFNQNKKNWPEERVIETIEKCAEDYLSKN